MRRIINISICFALLGFAGCEDAEEFTGSPFDYPTESVFGFDTYDEAEKTLGEYAKIFLITNGSVRARYNEGINIDNSQGSYAELSGRYSEQLGAFDFRDIGTLSLADIYFTYSSTKRKYEHNLTEEQALVKSSELFGKEINYAIKNGGNILHEGSLYSPDRINVLPESDDFYPRSNALSLSKSQDFKFIWNSDPDNENGIVAYFYATGQNLGNYPVNNPHDPNAKPFTYAAKFDDIGSGTIPSSALKSLNPGDILDVLFIRGNISIDIIDNKSFRFLTITQHPFQYVVSE